MDISQNTPAASGVTGGNGVINPQSSEITSVVSDDPKQNLNQVINSIQKTLGLLHQLYLTVSSFNAALQLPLLQRINSLVAELDNMVMLSEKCNIQVPMEVLNLIDDGKNPDEFTRDVINSCIAKNQITKGKTDAFKSLRKHLLEELEQTFPEDVESFREIRAASAAINSNCWGEFLVCLGGQKDKSMDISQNTPAASGVTGGNGVINPQSSEITSVVSDDPKQNLNQVINSIQKTLGLLHQLYLTVSSFNAALQLPLLQRINSLVAELDNMVMLSEKCNIQVPMEVLNLIDDGKNPDEFTRDVINSCIAKNQITKGKTDAFKSLRKHLLEELEQTFPEDVESFREIRAASAAEAKRLAQLQSVLPNGDMKVKTEP